MKNDEAHKIRASQESWEYTVQDSNGHEEAHTPRIFFGLPTWKRKENITSYVVVALSRQGTLSFQHTFIEAVNTMG